MLCVCFKQNTANEMRMRDWSSDVCSSNLVGRKKREPESARLSDQREFGELPHQGRRQNGEPRGVPGEVGGRVGRLQIAPPLMRALGTGANENEQRIDMDRDAPALGLAETQDRRARAELVLDEPGGRSEEGRGGKAGGS